MSLLSWIIPTALAASPPRQVNVCRSFFNFLHLPCAGDAGATHATSSIAGLITRGIDFVLGVSASGALVVIVYGCVLIIFSSAVPEQLAKGRKLIIYAVIGLVVVMSGFIVTTTIRIVVYGLTF